MSLADKRTMAGSLFGGYTSKCPEVPQPEEVLGGGLEPPCLTAYAPQTYVSAISPPELGLRHKKLADEEILARLNFHLARRKYFPHSGRP